MVTHNKKVTLTVVQEEKCHEVVGKHGCPCQKSSCGQWINYSQGKNCMFVTTQSGPLTLNEIGQIYGLTRMRICQIEKGIYQKISHSIKE